MAVGIICSYLVFLIVGLLESIAIHNGATPLQARDQVAGQWGRYALFVGAQLILGIGYIMLFRYVSSVVGKETIRAYWATFFGRMRNAGSEAMKVHPRAAADSYAAAQRKALASGLIEAVGLMGIGWLFSGRPFIGIMLLGGWISGFLTFMYVVSAIAGGTVIPYFAIIFYTFTLISGFNCYRSYMRDARARLAAVS